MSSSRTKSLLLPYPACSSASSASFMQQTSKLDVGRKKCTCINCGVKNADKNDAELFHSRCHCKGGFSHKSPLFARFSMAASATASVFVFCLLLPAATSQSTAKCYFFGPGITIPGADYRRDFGLTQNQCARVCRMDACCMAFEWHKELAMCTLKSRSLNGTVTNVDSGIFFGLCLDYADFERNRFWDHEVEGRTVASVPNVEREKCFDVCKKHSENEPGKSEGFLRILRARRNDATRKSRSFPPSAAVIYSWHSADPNDMDKPVGRCDCISVLQGVKLSFGSFAGIQV